MDLFHAVILALIQGITEFLPISSSAHLILPFQILGWPDQGLAFDTAVHLGSLIAVVAYFRAQILELMLAVARTAQSRTMTPESRFAANLLLASLPLIPAGLLLKDLVETELRALEVIIATTIVFGIALFVADRVGKRTRYSAELTWQHALMIGAAQCLALVPGTSRSGVTMTMGLLAGYTREAASRISFLISIPAIAGAATLKLIDLITAEAAVDWLALGVGLAVSGISAYVCITLFLDVISRIGFLPFVVYRLLLGGILLLLVL